MSQLLFFYESLCNCAMDIHNHSNIANAWHTLTTKSFQVVLHCVTEEGKEFQTEHVLHV